MISRVRMRRLSGFSLQRQQLAAAKTGGDSNPPFRERGEGGRGGGEDGRGRDRRRVTREGWREGRRKQINTGEQEGPANERTDAKSSADQRRDASQSSLSLSLLFCSCRSPYPAASSYRSTGSARLRRLESRRRNSVITHDRLGQPSG